MIINPTLPYGFVIFCDDIRHEVTGKITIVGAYSRELNFRGAAPGGLPQLNVVTWYRIDPKKAPSTVEFRLVFETVSGEESLLVSATVDLAEQLAKARPRKTKMATSDPHALPHYELQQIMQLSAVTFAEPGRLKCRVYYDDNEVRIGSLSIGFLEPTAEPQIPPKDGE